MDKQVFSKLSVDELLQMEAEVLRQYENFATRNLSLNMARGKPAPTLLDNSNDVLGALTDAACADGTDARNYGILDGIPEMRKFFGDLLGIDTGRIIVGGNSSLNLM